jgi:hypothetical protein
LNDERKPLQRGFLSLGDDVSHAEIRIAFCVYCHDHDREVSVEIEKLSCQLEGSMKNPHAASIIRTLRYPAAIRYRIILLIAVCALSGSLYSQGVEIAVVGTWFRSCPHPYQPGYQKIEGTTLVFNADRTGTYMYVHAGTGQTIAVPLTWELKNGLLQMTRKDSSGWMPVIDGVFEYDSRKKEFKQPDPEGRHCYWRK